MREQLKVAIHDIVDDERRVMRTMSGLAELLHGVGHLEHFNPRDARDFCLFVSNTIKCWQADLKEQNNRLWEEYKAACPGQDNKEM